MTQTNVKMNIKRKKPFDPEWYLKQDRHEWVLANILKQRADELGDKPFLQFQTETPYSFKQVNEAANKVANALIESGVEKGARVSILMPNCADYVMIWFGILKAGAVMSPINNAYKMDFLEYVLDNADSKVLFIAEELLDRLKPIESRISHVVKTVVWTRGGSKKFDAAGVQKSLISYAEFIENSSTDEPDADPIFNDVARLMYTSGTTGRSKGVLKPNAADYYSANGYCELMELTADDVVFTCLPLFHSNAQVLSVYPALIAGAKIVIYERFSGSNFWKWIKESGTTIFNLLGAMNYFLWRQDPPIPEEKEHNVRLTLIAPSPHDILEEYMERFNIKILEGYGLTETGVVTYMRPNEDFRIGSCGKEAPGYEVKIVNTDTDEEVESGQVGEIVVRPRIPNIMLLRYHKMPEKTVTDFRNFWFHTGDAGRIDSDGYVYFVDRVKDYIRKRGENISSFEVERIICQHPSVKEAAAFGLRAKVGKYSEDELMVVAVKAKGAEVTFEELIKHCEERMPYFMIPNYVRFVEALPKTPTERVMKHILKEQGITKDTWDLEASGYKIKR